MKRVLVLGLSLMCFFLFPAVFYGSENDPEIQYHSQKDSFSLFLKDRNVNQPFIKIIQLPKVPRKAVSLDRNTKNPLQNLPFHLFLDSNLDGQNDLELSPEKFPDLKGELGFQVNNLSPAGNKHSVASFDRIEIQIHDALNDSSFLKRRGFKINRIIIKRLSDGNLHITLRDKFYHSGKDLFIKTDLSW
jgi:hypothetical protein